MKPEGLDTNACASCGGCQKNEGCSDCHGCARDVGGELLLCREEILILEELAQFAFLPVIERRAPEGPRYLPVEGVLALEEALFSQAIESLLWKKLIVLDALPMQNLSYGIMAEDAACTCGSIGLTLQGQEAVTLLSLTPWTD